MTSFDQFVKHLIAQATGGNGNGNGATPLPPGAFSSGGSITQAPPPPAPMTPAYNNARVNPFGGFTPMPAPEAAVQQQVAGQAGPNMPPELAALVQMAAIEQARDDAGLPTPPSSTEQAATQIQQVVGAVPNITAVPSPTEIVNAVTPDAINRENITNLIPDQISRDNIFNVAQRLPVVGPGIGAAQQGIDVVRQLAALPGLSAETARSPGNVIEDLTGRYAKTAARAFVPGVAPGEQIASLLTGSKRAKSVSDVILGQPLTNLIAHPEQAPGKFVGAIEPTHPLSTGENLLGGLASIPLYARPQHEVLDRVGDIQKSLVSGEDTTESRIALGIMTLGGSEVMRLRPGQHKAALDEDAGRFDVIKAAIDQGVPPAAFLDMVVGGDDAVKAAQASSGGNDTYNAVHAVARNKLPWGLDFAYDVVTGMPSDPWTLTMMGPGLIGSFNTEARAVTEASVARQALDAMEPTARDAALGGKTVEQVLADPEARATLAGHGDAAGFVPDPAAVGTATRYQAAANIVKTLVHIAELPEKALFKPVGLALKGLTYPIRGAFAPAERAAKQARERGVTEGVGQLGNVQARQAELEAARQAAMAGEGAVGPRPEDLGPEIPPDLMRPGVPRPETLEPAPGPIREDLLQGPQPTELFQGPQQTEFPPTNGARAAAEAQQAAVVDLANRTLPTDDQLTDLPEDPVAAAAATAEAAKPPIQLTADQVNDLLDYRETRDRIEAGLAKDPTNINLINRLATTQNFIYRLITTAEGAKRELYPNPLNVAEPERGRLPIEDRVDGELTQAQAAPPAEPAPVAAAAPAPTQLDESLRPMEINWNQQTDVVTFGPPAEEMTYREATGTTRDQRTAWGEGSVSADRIKPIRTVAADLVKERADAGQFVVGEVAGGHGRSLLQRTADGYKVLYTFTDSTLPGEIESGIKDTASLQYLTGEETIPPLGEARPSPSMGPRPSEVLQGPQPSELIPGPRPEELIPGPRPEELTPGPQPDELISGPRQDELFQGPELPVGPEVGPTEDLGDLGPQPGKNRIPEQVAAHGTRYPAAAKAFWDAYAPRAIARRTQQAATDLRLRGTPELRTARAVEAAEHLVQEIQPLFREHVGREPEVIFNKGKGKVARRTTPQLLDRMLHDSDPLKRADAYNVLNWLSRNGRTELAPYMDRIRALKSQNEAERFPSADAERTGPRHEALGTSAQRSYNPWPTATDPITEAWENHDLSDENYQALIEPVEVQYTNAKGKSVTHELRVIDAYTRNLQTMGPEEALRATFKQIDDAERALPKGQKPPPAARRYFRPLKAFDRLQTFTRNKQQFSLLTFPRGFSFDWAGDAGLMLANGEGHAVWRAGLPGGKLFRRALKEVQGQTADGLVNSDGGIVAQNLGLDTGTSRLGHGFAGEVSPENVGPDGRVRLPAEQWVLDRTGSRGLSKATGAVVGSQTAANLRQSGDLVRRWSFWTTEMIRRLPEQRQAYLRELARTGAANGLDAAAVRRITTTLGEQFAPADVRRLATAEGLSDGVAKRLANDWQHRVTTMDKEARARVNQILPDFSKTTKADEVMRRFFMYHFWLTRASPIYLRTVLKNPALLREFNNYASEMREQCEGRGGQMCGWARIFTEHGFGLWGNPGAVFSTIGLDLDPERSLGPDATTYDKIKNKVPFMTSPLVDAATSYLGLSSRSPDILAMAGDTNAAVAGVNALKARGLIPGAGPAPIANPYLKIVNGISRNLSGVFGDDEGILRQQPDIDPTANDTSNIQWRATELVADKYNLTPTLDTASWPKQAVVELTAAKKSILAGNYDDPIAKHALKDWTAGNVTGQALKYVFMGGVPVRSQYKIDERTAAQFPTQAEGLARGPRFLGQGPAPAGIVPSDSAAALAAAGAQSQLDAGDMGSMADLELWTIDQKRNALLVDETGTPTAAGRADALYNDIVYGDTPADVLIGGERLSGGDLVTLPRYDSDITPETALISRDAIAKRALVEQGLFADWQTLKTTEDQLAADPANARWKALQSYRKGVREQGPAAFIEAAIKGNPSYQYWYDHLSDQTKSDPARLEAAAQGIDAFLALMGEKSSAWTPKLDTRDESQIPYNPAIEGTGAEPGVLSGGGAGADGFTHKSRGQMVLEDQAKYEAQVAMVKPVLFQLTGDPDFDLANTNPMLQTALMNELDAMGLQVPSLPKSVQRYQTWKATQPKGADTSLLAYTQFGEAFDASMAGTGKDFDMVMDILAAKGVPGFSALGALGLDGVVTGGSPLEAVGSRSGSAPSVLDVMNRGGGGYAQSTNDILNRRRGYTQSTSDILGNGRFAQTVNELLRGR